MTDPVPLSLVLEFARANNAGDPYAFQLAPQDYTLRGSDGSYDSFSLPWGSEILADLNALRLPGRDPVVVQRMGERLRGFLHGTDWRTHETAIASAVDAGRPIVLTVRSAAAELYALPWELLTLRATGRPLGALPSLLIRYAWPSATATPVSTLPSEGGRILIAWAGPKGAVPASEHIAAIHTACQAAALPQVMVPERDVLPNVSCGRLVAALAAAQRSGPPISILHILCHGAAVGSTFGLMFNGEEPGDEPIVVDAGRLRDLIAPYASMIRLIVLAACDSSNIGSIGNQLGSVAQTLHRAGVAQVVASRFPLSISGSIRLTQTLYGELLEHSASVEQAVVAGRRQLAQDAAQLDWASLQLYGHATPGNGRPIQLRPYRGLLAFTPEHRRFFFGRQKESQEIAERVCALRAAAEPRLLAVDGASGSGKSSVVLAGAVPVLLSLLGPGARVVVRQPGSEPLTALDGMNAPAEGPVVLVIDQFEELFTQTPETAEGQKLRRQFARQLWQLATAKSPDVSVILTVRSDFVGRCGELVVDDSGLRLDRVLYESGALAHRISIAQLLPVQLRAVIEGPAAVVGLELESGLTERMLADVESEPGALPLLADTLDALWLRRQGVTMTGAAYEALGGVTGTLTERAEQLIAELGADEPVVRRLMLELVNLDPESGQRTRRRVKLAELEPPAADAARFERVLHQLTGARLLVRAQAGGAETVEVAHEALLRRWPRLGVWLKEDRQRLAELRRLEAWAQEFRQSGAVLRGPQLAAALDMEVVKNGRADLPQAVRALLESSEQTRLLEEKKERLARDSQRLLAARQMAYDPTRAATILREVESADPTQVPEWLAQVTTLLHRAVLTRCELVGHKNRIGRVRLSPDGALIATASADGTARLWEAQEGGALATLAADKGGVLDVSFSPDGRWVILATDSGSVPIYAVTPTSDANAAPAVPVGSLSGHTAAVLVAQWSPDGRRVLTAAADMTARLWSISPDSRGVLAIKSLKVIQHRAPLCAAQWSPDGHFIVSADTGGELLLTATDAASETRSVGPSKGGRGAAGAHKGRITGLAFSPDGSQIVSAGVDGAVRLWEVKSGRLLRPLQSKEEDANAEDERDTSAPTAVAFHPEGTYVAIGHKEGGVRVVHVDGKQPLLVLPGHEESCTAASFSPDGQLLATASTDGTAALWGFVSPTIPAFASGHRGEVTDLIWSTDSRRLITAASDHCARVWDLGRPALDSPTAFDADPAKLPEFLTVLYREDDEKYKTQRPQGKSGDGKRLATVDAAGKVAVTSLGRTLATVDAAGGHVTALALSPAGNRLAVAANPEKGIGLWDLAGPKQVASLTGHTDECYSLCFSPDGTLLATAALDWTVRLWRLGDHAELLQLVMLDGAGTLVLFSKDGKRLAIASESDGLDIWDREGGRRALIDPGREEYCLAVRRDLGACITEDPDGNYHLWPLDLDATSLRQRLWRATPMCLSMIERQQLLGETAEESQQNFARSVEAVRSAAAADTTDPGGAIRPAPPTCWDGEDSEDE